MSRLIPVLALGLLAAACDRGPPAPILSIASGSVTHSVCTAEFVSGRGAADLRRQEFSGLYGLALLLTRPKIDRAARTVTGRGPFGATAMAVVRPGLGCILLSGRTPEDVKAFRADGPTGPAPGPAAVWPAGERVDLTAPIPGVDRAKLDLAMDTAFGRCPKGNDPFTRAIVVVHGGRIVAERYGKGFDAASRPYGASMSKSVAATLLGLRIAEGRMALDGVALPPGPGRPDPVSNRDLVTMTAGLAFNEDYDADSDVNRMLMMEPDMAAAAARHPAYARPGAVWKYSSGATNILMRSLRDSFAGDDQAYWNYPRKALFDPLGMRSAIFQTDASGTLVGSSFMWATPRDWARLGLLYLNRGRWNGRQLLPGSWVDYVRTPSPPTAALKGDDHLTYGAGFWLDGADGVAPAPVYAMGGWAFQKVRIEPARDLVIVRMGHTLKDCPSASIEPIAALFPKVAVSPARPTARS
ncbi:MAG TPA: serine hydrolase [Caulobacter sp.]|nr:serine hydrolase [Caulobacter sp.]